VAVVLALTLVLAACASVPTIEVAAEDPASLAAPAQPIVGSTTRPLSADQLRSTPTSAVTPSSSAAVSSEAEASPGAPSTTSPELLAGGVDPATLETSPDGAILVQETPPQLRNRQLSTVDTLPPPAAGDFEFTIQPLAGEPLQRSTWQEDCPVSPDGLRYVTVSFWGFDDAPHTGELIVAASEADRIVNIFRTLFANRFPIEEMRIVTDADLTAKPTGDTNNSASYVCRAVTGGTRFSEHAFGLAVDINPFQNPYASGDVVIPQLAISYLDRDLRLRGMLQENDIVVWAFDEAGWFWGGRWTSLRDYQHFSANGR